MFRVLGAMMVGETILARVVPNFMMGVEVLIGFW